MADLGFSVPVAEWFNHRFSGPTEAQRVGWASIQRGDHTLLFAPTGSGKTLAAFLVGIDRVMTTEPAEATTIVYLSPLRALAVDVQRNLVDPIEGITATAAELGLPVRAPTVGLRTGDTSSKDRRNLIRTPPDILITTPESLYLMLTSQARDTLRSVHTVIVDEIHAVAPTKRGAHMALTLERLSALAAQPIQRIGLSATQYPLDEVARFLGGFDGSDARPVTIVDPPIDKRFDIAITVPVADMSDPQADQYEEGDDPGMWPAIQREIYDLVIDHHTTLVFVNSRRLAERLAQALNDLDPTADDLAPLVLAHHGSLSRERRLAIEHQLKSGELRALVATSSLELGIDMGAVDLVVQISSPTSVSRGLQRIGRAGHNVGDVSTGRVLPTHRHDLLEATVIVDRMSKGQLETTRYPRNPIDVLAQHVVSACAMDDWRVDDLYQLVRRAANFHGLAPESFRNVLDLLSGRYPSERFRQLRPRIVWNRSTDTLQGRRGSQLLAVTNAGTIPDRGLFGVFLADGTRVGELDEEMVHEARPGETFLLGATSWRIEEITFERVVVSPAPGVPAKMPFWHGEGLGRPVELGQAIGAFVRNLTGRTDDDALGLLSDTGLDTNAGTNLVAYLQAQREATGQIPDDHTIVVERFRDEIGDWRVCVHSPLGGRVLAPLALALRRRLSHAMDQPIEVLWSDDGIAIRLPEGVDQLPLDALRIDPTEIDHLVTAELPGSALFASRFREAAGRALLLPRRRPGQRTSLWQQRMRSADLLGVASEFPDFPILLEVVREVINDEFDLPALRQLLADIANGTVGTHFVDTSAPSPFAQSLVFGWAATFMYEGDAPSAERKAAALQLDPELLRQLLGTSDLRDLLDPDALAMLEDELARRTPTTRAHSIDGLRDLLAAVGPLPREELVDRFHNNADLTLDVALASLVGDERTITVAVAGQEQWVAIEDAPMVRDAFNLALTLPGALAEPYPHALRELVARHAATHGPFTTSDVARRFAVADEAVAASLDELVASERLTRGEFRPGGSGEEFCDVEVLRRARQRSLAALRAQVEPVGSETLVRFLADWHGIEPVDGRAPWRQGSDGVYDVIAQLEGAPLLVSTVEMSVLPSRVDGYTPADLDALCTTGSVIWMGVGSVGDRDGRICFARREHAPAILAALASRHGSLPQEASAPSPPTTPDDQDSPTSPTEELPDLHVAIEATLHDHLAKNGASFFADMVQATAQAGIEASALDIEKALWTLVWAGKITNDSFAPVRAYRDRVRSEPPKQRPRRRTMRRTPPRSISSTSSPSVAGRWSLLASVLDAAPNDTEVSHAVATGLLDRYGIVTRESALGEGVEGGFAGVYPVFKALEERGSVRRGYFIEGLGAAQFAHLGAVERLRRHRDDPPRGSVVVMAATDPAQPLGAALRWPTTEGHVARIGGAFVVFADGSPTVYVSSGGRNVVPFAGSGSRWAAELATAGRSPLLAHLEVQTISGETPSPEDLAQLREAGFERAYKGWRSPRH